QHGDGVLAGKRRPERAPRDAGLPVLEDRRIPPFRKLDHERVRSTFFAVVPDEPRAQPPRLHAHDRVGTRVERRILVEDLYADHVFLQLIATPGERFQDDESEKPFEAVDLPERDARQHALELLPGCLAGILLLPGGFAPRSPPTRSLAGGPCPAPLA